MSTAISADEIGRQLSYRMYQATSVHQDVPEWLDPVPDDLAEAVKARDEVWSRLVELEDECQAAIGAINSAEAADAQAIRDAARASKPLPKQVDRENLRRQLAYAFESVLPLFAENSQANGRVRHAVDAAAATIVTQAVAVSRHEQAEYKRLIEEARRSASEAMAAFGRAQGALNWVSNLEPVRQSVQYTTGGDGQVRVDAPVMAIYHLAQTCKMLEDRGLTERAVTA